MDSLNISNLLSGVVLPESGKNLFLAVQNLPQGLRAGMILTLSEVPDLKNLFSGDLFKIKLKDSNGVSFSVDVKTTFPKKLETVLKNWQNLTFEVTSDGELKIQQYKESNAVHADLSVKNTFNKMNNANSTSTDKITNIDFKPIKVETQPIKILDTINTIMRDIDFPQSLKNDIVELITDTDVVAILKEISNEQKDFTKFLEPIKNTLLQIKNFAGKPAEVAHLQQQLVQDIRNLSGQTFIGKINYSEPADKKTVFSSLLGNIDVDMPINLPLSETAVFEITKVNMEQAKEVLPVIKIFSDKLAEIWPKDTDIVYKPELLEKILSGKNKSSQNILKIFKPLAELPQSPEVMMVMLQKIPGISPKDVLSDLYKFYKAVIKDSPIEWIGEKLKTDLLTTKQGTEALKQIEYTITNSVRETAVWREVEIPFFDGSQVQIWKMAVRKDNENEKGKNVKVSGKRFIIDTVFSMLGEFQFDGFASLKERKFDLIIRTSKLQSNDFCMQVMNLFKKSLYDTNYVGTIKINQKEAFVCPIKTESLPQDGVYI